MRNPWFVLGVGGSLVLVLGTLAGGQGATVVGATPIGSPGSGGPGNIGPGVPVFPCINPNPHFLGEPVILFDTLAPVGTTAGVHLDALGGPPGGFGFFLISADATTPVAVDQGLLCLTLPIARFSAGAANATGNPAFDSLGQFDTSGSGVFLNLSGTATSTGGVGFDLPIDRPPPFGPGAFQSGERWWLQMWYRDQDLNGAPTSNFSSAVEVEIP